MKAWELGLVLSSVYLAPRVTENVGVLIGGFWLLFCVVTGFFEAYKSYDQKI